MDDFGFRYYNKFGEQITSDEFTDLIEGGDSYRRVGLWVGWTGEQFVSTVWLGIDHSFGVATFPPVIFETLVTDKGEGFSDVVERYTTLAEAMAGHSRWVLKYGGDPAACNDLIPEWWDGTIG